MSQREYQVSLDISDDDRILYDGVDFSEAMSIFGFFQENAVMLARWPGEQWGPLSKIDTYDYHYPD